MLPLLLAQYPLNSGGPLRFEQAVYDVQAYDIALSVSPRKKSLSGTTLMTAKAVIPTDVILLDLDSPYRVTRVDDGAGRPLRYERTADGLRIRFSKTKEPGERIMTRVAYAGAPRISEQAPWTGGFEWKATKSGAPWIGVALQGEGADLLFPCKDHPSDKPDRATLRITVPDPLMAVGPGRLLGTRRNGDGTSTYHWRMSSPINNYSLVFNAAPYRVLTDRARSVDGTEIPIRLYLLPEDFAQGARLVAELKKYLAFMERYCGPYPFRREKLGVVQSTHLGMEHSTAIAYGNRFRYAKDGSDWLLLHEFGHEWWANLVTASDWKDFWIHEGFQTYLDALYQEHLHGRATYLKAMRERAKDALNLLPIAPREPRTTHQMYNLPPDYTKANGDIYFKASVVLHTLRYLIGDPAFFRALRRMAYPTPALERRTDGGQVRFATTDDFLTVAERESGQDLDWFFEVYLRRAKLPKLVSRVEGANLRLEWETPDGLPFPMPVEVEVDGQRRRVPMPGGKATLPLPDSTPKLDPNGWILKAE